MSNKSVIALFALLVLFSSLADFAQRLYFHNNPLAPTTAFGSGSDNYLQTYPSATKVFVNAVDTLVVATSSGRQYLELNNISGATTTAQMVSCNYGDRPAVLYQGTSIIASTSKVFMLDNLYRGAIHCIAPGNGATISVSDF